MKGILERVNIAMTIVKKQGREPKRLYVGINEKNEMDHCISQGNFVATLTEKLEIMGLEIIEVNKEDHLECV